MPHPSGAPARRSSPAIGVRGASRLTVLAVVASLLAAVLQGLTGWAGAGAAPSVADRAGSSVRHSVAASPAGMFGSDGFVAGNTELGAAVPDFSFVPQVATSAQIDRVEQVVHTTYTELVDDWTGLFGTPTTVMVRLVRPTDPITFSACSSDSPANEPLTAFFCPRDDTIWLNDLLLVGFDQRFGDFAVATVLAHEYGHVLQWRAGVFDLNLATEDTELHADCLAGLFAHTEQLAGQVTDADAAAARGGLQAVGDTNLDSPNHHGTPAQRVAAWERGFEGESCPLGGLG